MKTVNRTDRWWLKAATLLLLTTLLNVGSVSAQPTDHTLMSQLVIYLEVPDDATGAGISLSLESVALIGSRDTVSLTPLTTSLSVDKLRGKQVRLVDETIEPGLYDSLLVKLSSVAGHIGPAQVSPRVDDNGYAVIIDLGAEANSTEAVFLNWPGSRLHPDDTLYRLDWRHIAKTAPPFGSLIFVTNEASHNMTVVDRADHRVTDVVRTGQGPRDLIYSVLSRRMYVANAESNDITVVDALSQQPLRSIALLFGDEPSRLALSPDERYLYVLNYGSRTLVIVDTRSYTQVARHQVGFGPRGMAVDPQSGLVYVADEDSDDLIVYDPIALRELPRVIATGGSPSELLIDERGDHLFLASGERRRLNVYDLSTSAQTQTIKICSPPAGLAYDPVTRRVYASLSRCKEISIMQPESGVELHTVRMPSEPGLIALDSERRSLLIVLPEEAGLGVMTTTRRKLETIVPVGDKPYKAIAPR